MKSVIWATLFIAFVIGFSTVNATTFRPMSFEETIQSAEFVCAFQVGQRSSEVIRQNVYSVYSLDTLECFKGDLTAGLKISLYVIGGVENGSENSSRKVTVVPGAPTFKKGKSYVMSIRHSPRGYSLDDWQSLDVESDGSQFFVVANRGHKNHHAPNGLGSINSKKMSFSEFRQKVRSVDQ